MKLASVFNADSLAGLGNEAVDLLRDGKIRALAGRFGYALCYGRDPATVITEDLQRSLLEVGANALAPAAERPAPTVTDFEANSSHVQAVVECLVPADNGAMLLVELVVTGEGADKHVTLEQITAPKRQP